MKNEATVYYYEVAVNFLPDIAALLALLRRNGFWTG